METPATAVQVTDLGSLRKYYSPVPHLVVDDERLTRDDRALYLYYKRVAGEDGACYQANKTVSDGSKLGMSLLKESRARLAEHGYIIVEEKAGRPTLVTILDIWDENMQRYARGRVATTLPGRVATTPGRVATGGGRTAATGGRVATRKNNPLLTNLEEESIQEQPTALQVQELLDARPAVFKLYEKHIGLVTGAIGDKLREMVQLYPEEWLTDAFEEAVKRGVLNIAYIARILERWAIEGRKKATKNAAEGDSARAQMLRRYTSAQGGN